MVALNGISNYISNFLLITSHRYKGESLIIFYHNTIQRHTFFVRHIDFLVRIMGVTEEFKVESKIRVDKKKPPF